MDMEVRCWMNFDLWVMITLLAVVLSFEIKGNHTDHHPFLMDVDFRLEMVN